MNIRSSLSEGKKCIIFWVTVYLLFLLLKRVKFRNHQKSDSIEDTIRAEWRIQFNDSVLIEHLRTRVLQPPSQRAYNLKSNFTRFYYDSDRFYHNFSKALFSDIKNGFFIEAGAFDGESMSNTLWLEMENAWNGLLVEPDPMTYEILTQKHRKAWSANCCLAVTKYPKMETLSYDSNYDKSQPITTYFRGMSYMKESVDKEATNREYNVTSTESYNASCYPLASLLLALGSPKVDLLSLDVEFIEVKILNTIDFHYFDIQVIFIEWTWTDTKWLMDFMTRRSYAFVDNIVMDFIFVKKGTPYEQMAKKKNLFSAFKLFI